MPYHPPPPASAGGSAPGLCCPVRKRTKKCDVVVIGSGSGAAVVDIALRHDLSVNYADRGALGGTCLNVGCIPIGSYAPILIHEVIGIMANGGTIGWIVKDLHIHPALSEVVSCTLYHLRASQRSGDDSHRPASALKPVANLLVLGDGDLPRCHSPLCDLHGIDGHL